MAEAKIEKTIANISISTTKEILVAQGEVLKFDGFLKVYLEGTDDEDEKEEAKMLPPLKEGQDLNLKKGLAKENFSRPPARYTEASLVKKMEEMGIGRPSTYAPTISTIQDRGYIEKKGLDPKKRESRCITLISDKIEESSQLENHGAEKNKLFPTEIGKIVNDFLVKYFAEVVNYGFTAKVEEEFDAIANGTNKWNDIIKNFYTGFHKTVEDAGGISREEASQSRELGTDPKSGKPVTARLGRFGPMIQIGTRDDEEKPKFASIPEGETIESITLDVALEQFKFPKILGKNKNGDDIAICLGRFGPYIKCGKLNASLKKKTVDDNGDEIPGDEAGTITLKRAKELLKEKAELEAKKYIAQWDDVEIEVLRGPYGIYIKSGKKGNVRIPKTIKDPEKLTKAEVIEIVEKAPIKKGRRVVRKKTAKKSVKKKITKKTIKKK
jgi:DNA topoisomerase-1